MLCFWVFEGQNEISIKFDLEYEFPGLSALICGGNEKLMNSCRIILKNTYFGGYFGFLKVKNENTSNSTSTVSFRDFQHSFVVEMRS